MSKFVKGCSLFGLLLLFISGVCLAIGFVNEDIEFVRYYAGLLIMGMVIGVTAPLAVLIWEN